MKPTLLLIGGTHGAGKSTLGTRLSRELGWPLLSRDQVRQAMAWTANEAELVPSGELSQAAVRVFFEVLAGLIAAGVSTVADSTFRRGLSEGDLRILVGLAHVRLVHCVVDRSVAIERCRGRKGREVVAEMLKGRDESRWERVEKPLALDVPTLMVDTTDGYAPSLSAIVEFARERRS